MCELTSLSVLVILIMEDDQQAVKEPDFQTEDTTDKSPVWSYFTQPDKKANYNFGNKLKQHFDSLRLLELSLKNTRTKFHDRTVLYTSPSIFSI